MPTCRCQLTKGSNPDERVLRPDYILTVHMNQRVCYCKATTVKFMLRADAKADLL